MTDSSHSARAAGRGEMPEFVYNLHQKYGRIVSLAMGEKTFVYIKDGGLVKRLFATEAFMERPVEDLFVAKKLSQGKFKGLISCHTLLDRKTRSFDIWRINVPSKLQFVVATIIATIIMI